MRRWLFNILAAVSFFIAGFTSSFYIASMGGFEGQILYLKTSETTAFGMRSGLYADRIAVFVFDRHIRKDFTAADHQRSWQEWLRLYTPVWGNFLGVRYWHNHNDENNQFVTYDRLIIPHVHFLISSILILMGWCIVRYRLRKLQGRASRGLCPTCTYNLTGNTSGICPECGTAIVSHLNTQKT